MKDYREHKEDLAKQRELVRVEQRKSDVYKLQVNYLTNEIEKTKFVIENLNKEINSNPQEVIFKNRKELSENSLKSQEKELKRKIKFPLTDIGVRYEALLRIDDIEKWKENYKKREL